MKQLPKHIAITGIYHDSVIKVLSPLNIYHYGLDFRPKSFQFIPEYQALDMLSRHREHKIHWYFQFEHILDPMILKLAKDVSELGTFQNTFIFSTDHLIEVLNKSSNGRNELTNFLQQENFLLELPQDLFSQDLSSGLLHHLRLARYQMKGLSGFIIPFDLLKDLLHQGKLRPSLQQLQSIFSEMEVREHQASNEAYAELFSSQFKIVLKCKWGDNLYISLFDYLAINEIHLSIDAKVETHYRQIDNKKIVNEIRVVRSNFSHSL